MELGRMIEDKSITCAERASEKVYASGGRRDCDEQRSQRTREHGGRKETADPGLKACNFSVSKKVSEGSHVLRG
jgi:hypothetical protein